NDGYTLLNPVPGNASHNETGVKILRQPDGNYLFMGETYPQKPVLWRLLSNGAPAIYAASYSYKVFDVAGNFKPVDMTFGANGRIVIAGEFEPSGATYKEFAAIQINDALAVGTNQPDNSEATLLYPNPAKDQATFEFELRESGSVSLVMYDSQGRVLHRFLTQAFYPSGKNTLTLHLPPNLASGLYLFQFSTEKGNARKWLMIEN
ncbi:MAG: T9SS type A sorting domain-containing protein, partial [Saprospiraceae bacterium]|nr:T9SS type A sorting domain-containing protein [Saprospiraceae bacterium]